MNKPIDKLLDAVDWQPLQYKGEGVGGTPVATHEGWLSLWPDFKVHVFQLSDGQRVIAEEDVRKFLEGFG